MSVPLLDGTPVFGFEVTIRAEQEPRAVQEFKFFGYDGTGRLDGGRRGTTIRVEGQMRGATPELLGIAIAALRGFHDGASHTLLDNHGETWRQTVMTAFGTHGRIRKRPGSASFEQQYRCEFLCLTG